MDIRDVHSHYRPPDLLEIQSININIYRDDGQDFRHGGNASSQNVHRNAPHGHDEKINQLTRLMPAAAVRLERMTKLFPDIAHRRQGGYKDTDVSLKFFGPVPEFDVFLSLLEILCGESAY